MTLRTLLLTILLLTGGSVATAKEVPIPGLEMEGACKHLIEGWRKKAAQSTTSFAQCPVAIRRPLKSGGRQTLVEGTYRFELVRGAITWADPKRGKEVEQGWWRTQLDNLLVEPGVLFYLAHCKLKSQPRSGGGTNVSVTGRSPVKALRFDDKGLLSGMTVQVPAPGGGLHPADVDIAYARVRGHLLMIQYTMSSTAPNGDKVSEQGKFDWELVQGRPLPTKISLQLRMGERSMPVHIDLGSWKLKDEALAKMDLISSRMFQAWEKRELNLARRDFVMGECDVEFRRGGGVARGRYRFDGKRGVVTWQDPEVGKRLGTHWHITLDDLFTRFPTRVALGNRELVGRKDGLGRIIDVKQGLALDKDIGYRRFKFDPTHILREVQLTRADGTRGVLAPTYERFVYPKGHLMAGVTRYRAPKTVTGRWTRPGGSTYSTKKTMAYIPHRGVHVPSRIEMQRTEPGKQPVTLTFRLTNWRLTKEPSALTR